MSPRSKLRPRISIGMTMLAVVVVASNLAAMKTMLYLSAKSWGYLVFGSMPMASLLLLVLVAIVGDLRRVGEAKPFAIGFFALGGVGLSVMSVLLADADRVYPIVSDWIFKPFTEAWAGLALHANATGDNLGISLMVLAFMLPQLILGLIGGVVAERIGIRLQLRREGTAC